MFGFLKRLTGSAASVPDDDPEIQQEMADGLAALKQAEETGVLPVLETQHRAIGGDRCHLAVPASMPDRADAFGKLFVTDSRIVFAGGASVTLGAGRIIKVDRHQRDVVIVSGGDGLLRFRCNSFSDAMLAVWMLNHIRTQPTHPTQPTQAT
ncbi:MAG: hypothetical protein M3R55_02290 [Acidobacteriota bacterium]|nr:hypothetical protein [Acidobacteriota bacterium]